MHFCYILFRDKGCDQLLVFPFSSSRPALVPMTPRVGYERCGRGRASCQALGRSWRAWSTCLSGRADLRTAAPFYKGIF